MKKQCPLYSFKYLPPHSRPIRTCYPPFSCFLLVECFVVSSGVGEDLGVIGRPVSHFLHFLVLRRNPPALLWWNSCATCLPITSKDTVHPLLLGDQQVEIKRRLIPILYTYLPRKKRGKPVVWVASEIWRLKNVRIICLMVIFQRRMA
jgi:hypothetical protein